MAEASFLEFELPQEIMEALERLGYHSPTPVQEKVIPLALEGKDIVGQSQTGSGKTAAFGIPVCSKVKWEERQPQALVLEPTRELAVQVQEELFLIGRKKRLKIPVVFGGMPVEKQAISLKQKSHIVVGTPGRILDHMRRENLMLDQVRYLVIDEADLMLDMGFMEDVAYITAHTGGEKKPQILLFSATMEPHIEELVTGYMNQPVRIQIESPHKTADGITQIACQVEKEDKYEALLQVLIKENPQDAIIFCDTREMVNTLYQKLKRKKIRCGMLHGGMEQRERLYAISDFRKGIFHYLITTDVAARGIDLAEVSHVINYDFPTKKENYVHRIGRTGRNGRTGRAVSLISQEELHYKLAVEAYIESEIPWAQLQNQVNTREDEVLFQKKQKEKVKPRKGKSAVFEEEIQRLSIGGGRKSKMRPGDIVGAICSIPGILQEDIGAIDVRDSITYVEIQNKKGALVYEQLQKKTIKGKIRKIQKTGEQKLPG